MNKLFKLLLSFLFLYCLSALIFHFTENELLSLLATAISYLLLFALFSQKQEKNAPVKIGKGALLLLFFLTTCIFVSLLFPLRQTSPSTTRSVMAIFVFPVVEELFFRKTLFPALENVCPPWAAVIFSSIVFSSVHSGAAGMATAFAAGVVLALIYRRTRRLFLPILCHGTNNLTALFVRLDTAAQPYFALSFFASSAILFFLVRKDLLNE